MVTLRGLSRTITTTKNFWDAFFLKVSHGKKTIVFRNGVDMELNWEEFCRMRDWLKRLRDESFIIEKCEKGYSIKRKNPEFCLFTPILKTAPAFFEFNLSLISRGWIVEQIDNSLFHIKKNKVSYTVRRLDDDLFNVRSRKIKMVGPLESLWAYFCECESGVYDCDCSNKIVLDIGGFCGETAVFFSSRGAKKVIIYEPVSAHHKFIKRNLALNAVEGELHEEGIGEEDGIKIVNYESANLSFGILSEGKNELEVKIKNTANVIKESGADIGKFDCEGAETSLINVPEEILRRISFYIIETHKPEIRNAIMDKFSSAGFRLVHKPIDLTEDISVVHFERLP